MLASLNFSCSATVYSSHRQTHLINCFYRVASLLVVWIGPLFWMPSICHQLPSTQFTFYTTLCDKFSHIGLGSTFVSCFVLLNECLWIFDFQGLTHNDIFMYKPGIFIFLNLIKWHIGRSLCICYLSYSCVLVYYYILTYSFWLLSTLLSALQCQ